MRHIKLFCTVLCLFFATAGAALAAGDGHELPWGNFFFRIANFALFLGIIAYFFGAKIKGFFKGRTRAIADELAALEERKATAQKSLADVERRIADLDQERAKILADYQAQGEALKASILAHAEQTAAQMAEQAKASARNEIDQAIEAMRAEMAEKIVEATEKLLAEKLTAQEHAKLIDKYLTKVVLN